MYNFILKAINIANFKEKETAKMTRTRGNSLFFFITAGILAAFFITHASSAAAAEFRMAKIGFLHDLTGPYATYGVPMRDAMNWALEEINKKGFEVAGQKYRLEVITYDSATKPEVEGPGLVKKALYSDKVPLIFLGGTPITRVAAGPIESSKTPAIIILAATLGITEKNTYLFRIRPDASQCAPPLADFFMKTLKAKKLAVVGADTDFGRDSFKMWKGISEKTGGTVVSENWYMPGQVQDFYPILSKVKEAAADAVYVAGSTQQNAMVYKQAFEVGLKNPLGGYTGMTPEQARDLIGDKYDLAMANIYESRGVDPNVLPTKTAQEWYQGFKKRYGYFPADLTMWAWDAPFMAVKAFQTAGSVTDKEKIRSALEKTPILDSYVTPYVDLGGGRIFDNKRQAYSLAVVLKWKDKGWTAEKYYSVIGGEIKEVKAK
jgi:branched-chain amino acid transport system substrate-binding protein